MVLRAYRTCHQHARQVRRGQVAYTTRQGYTILCVRVHTGHINGKLLTATQAGEVTVDGELEVDVALLKLGRRREADC